MPPKKAANVESFSFYGGQVIIEKKPWGQHFRYSIKGRTGGILSSTRITGKLSKGDVLMTWAINTVTGHLRKAIEESKDEKFGRDWLGIAIDAALREPERLKVEGGLSGSTIHEYAHDFAKADIAGVDLPDPKPYLDKIENEETRKRAENGIGAFLDWFNQNNVEFLEMEKLLYYNSTLSGATKADNPFCVEYLGIADLVARVNGRIAVIDYKSSKGIYSDQEYQVDSYKLAYNANAEKGMEAADSMIVNFHKETGELLTKIIAEDESKKNATAFFGLFFVARREAEKGYK